MKKTLAGIFFILLGLGILAGSLYVLIYGKGDRIETTSAALFVPPSTGDNVSGFAWNDHTGWISFNSADCDVDGDGVYELNGEGNPMGTTPAPAFCPTTPPTPFIDYGVNIDKTTGVLSGTAWSGSVGWISFNRKQISNPGIDEAGNPPQAPYNTNINTDPIAVYDRTSGKINGWGKILSMGDDGWVSLQGMTAGPPPAPQPYGISVVSATKQAHGYAWNASNNGAGIGWISFNCNEGANDGTSVCLTRNYKVTMEVNQPPTLSNLKAPNWTVDNARTVGNSALVAKIQIDYSDDNGNLNDWELRVGTHGFCSDDPSVSCTSDAQCGGTCSLPPNSGPGLVYSCTKATPCPFDTDASFACLNNSGTCRIDLGAGHIDYANHYMWWVRAQDSNNDWSNWAQFNSGVAGNEDNSVPSDPNPLTFATYAREFPQKPSFSWFPIAPLKGENVLLTPNLTSTFYSNRATPATCNSDSNCKYVWNISGCGASDGVFPLDYANRIKQFKMDSVNNCTVSLTNKYFDAANDIYDSVATSSPIFGTKYKTPTWKETK